MVSHDILWFCISGEDWKEIWVQPACFLFQSHHSLSGLLILQSSPLTTNPVTQLFILHVPGVYRLYILCVTSFTFQERRLQCLAFTGIKEKQVLNYSVIFSSNLLTWFINLYCLCSTFDNPWVPSEAEVTDKILRANHLKIKRVLTAPLRVSLHLHIFLPGHFLYLSLATLDSQWRVMEILNLFFWGICSLALGLLRNTSVNHTCPFYLPTHNTVTC